MMTIGCFHRETLAKELSAALDWSHKLLVNGFRDASNCTGAAFEKFVEAQSCLYTSIVASKSKKLTTKAHERYPMIKEFLCSVN